MMASTTHLIQAEQLSARFQPLLLEAERVAQTVHQGVHGRRRTGLGENFWQFRPYAAGDPADQIDWRQSARTTKYYVREREWEAAQTACLWTDRSGSMAYASAPNLPTKSDRAIVLMLALGSLLLRGGEKIGWLGAEPLTVSGTHGMGLIAKSLGLPSLPVMPSPVSLPRNAITVLCSDFLMPDDELAEKLGEYAALNGKGVLVHILDPIEESFAFEGRLDMQGCENEPGVIIPNAAALREAYRLRLTAHKDQLRGLAAVMGWRYLQHITSESPNQALMNLYAALEP